MTFYHYVMMAIAVVGMIAHAIWFLVVQSSKNGRFEQQVAWHGDDIAELQKKQKELELTIYNRLYDEDGNARYATRDVLKEMLDERHAPIMVEVRQARKDVDGLRSELKDFVQTLHAVLRDQAVLKASKLEKVE